MQKACTRSITGNQPDAVKRMAGNLSEELCQERKQGKKNANSDIRIHAQELQ